MSNTITPTVFGQVLPLLHMTQEYLMLTFKCWVAGRVMHINFTFVHQGKIQQNFLANQQLVPLQRESNWTLLVANSINVTCSSYVFKYVCMCVYQDIHKQPACSSCIISPMRVGEAVASYLAKVLGGKVSLCSSFCGTKISGFKTSLNY